MQILQNMQNRYTVGIVKFHRRQHHIDVSKISFNDNRADLHLLLREVNMDPEIR